LADDIWGEELLQRAGKKNQGPITNWSPKAKSPGVWGGGVREYIVAIGDPAEKNKKRTTTFLKKKLRKTVGGREAIGKGLDPKRGHEEGKETKDQEKHGSVGRQKKEGHKQDKKLAGKGRKKTEQGTPRRHRSKGVKHGPWRNKKSK